MLDQDFNLQPSRYYQLTFIFFFITSMIILCCLPINLPLKLLFLFLLTVYGVYLVFHVGFLPNRYSIIRIRRVIDGQWILYTPTERVTATLDQNTTVTRFVSILCFRHHHSAVAKSCVIFPDALPKTLYRRLLVLLKLD